MLKIRKLHSLLIGYTSFDSELDLRNNVANYYSDKLYNSLIIPVVRNNYTSSWAQYSVLANDNKEREELMKYLNNSKGISFGVNRFGESAPYKKVYEHLDLSVEKIVLSIQNKLRK